jgi:hypothetical protein
MSRRIHSARPSNMEADPTITSPFDKNVEDNSTVGSDTEGSEVSIGSEKSESENEDSSEEEEEDTSVDFWKLLIRNAVMKLCSTAMQEGEPCTFAKNVKQLLEKPFLSKIIDVMRERVSELEALDEAGTKDKLLNTIQLKTDKVMKQLDEEDCTEEADKIAWKKYRMLIKKKLEQNLSELEPLVVATHTEM